MLWLSLWLCVRIVARRRSDVADKPIDFSKRKGQGRWRCTLLPLWIQSPTFSVTASHMGKWVWWAESESGEWSRWRRSANIQFFACFWGWESRVQTHSQSHTTAHGLGRLLMLLIGDHQFGSSNWIIKFGLSFFYFLLPRMTPNGSFYLSHYTFGNLSLKNTFCL